MNGFDSLEARIRKIIASTLGFDEQAITRESRLAEDLRADSLDIVELLQELEEATDTTIDERDAMGLRTVGDVVAYVRALTVDLRDSVLHRKAERSSDWLVASGEQER
ncbi:acyl carrier protein [Pendulispora albinea]|uniref:Acyl carrier protein n=1 Tax=Pendulispora albinea TaxID=2741071 RepID=A0ABZ2MB67_9BACT